MYGTSHDNAMLQLLCQFGEWELITYWVVLTSSYDPSYVLNEHEGFG